MGVSKDFWVYYPPIKGVELLVPLVSVNGVHAETDSCVNSLFHFNVNYKMEVGTRRDVMWPTNYGMAGDWHVALPRKGCVQTNGVRDNVSEDHLQRDSKVERDLHEI